MGSTTLDTLVAEDFSAVGKRREESEQECLRLLTDIVTEFKMDQRVLETLTPLTRSAESMFSILCVLIKDSSDTETMSHNLCEWFNRQSTQVKTFPLRIQNFKVPAYYFELLQDDPDVDVRIALAGHPCVPLHLLRKLKMDRDLAVQVIAARNTAIPVQR